MHKSGTHWYTGTLVCTTWHHTLSHHTNIKYTKRHSLNPPTTPYIASNSFPSFNSIQNGGHPPNHYPRLRLLNMAKGTGVSTINQLPACIKWCATQLLTHTIHNYLRVPYTTTYAYHTQLFTRTIHNCTHLCGCTPHTYIYTYIAIVRTKDMDTLHIDTLLSLNTIWYHVPDTILASVSHVNTVWHIVYTTSST